MDRLIRRLEREGKIRKQGAGLVQIESLLREALKDLDEAKNIAHIATRATYLLAYNAMLKAGRALLLFKGYIPADGGQHKTVVEMTSVILGENFRHLCDQFENMRRKRNELTYESGSLISGSDSKAAFSDARQLVKEVLEEVKSQNPQLELDFK